MINHMQLPKKVVLTEVSPRDGLQNEKKFVPTDIKIQFIELLSQAGFPIIETTSFVNPKKIPMLSDCMDVMKKMNRHPNIIYSVLIPNTQGLQNAIETNCHYINVITSASETFAQKNMNCSIDESIVRISEIIKIAKPNAIFVRATISCALGCPDEGDIPHEKTAAIAKKILALGCDQITIADTIGKGTPEKTKQLIQTVSQCIPIEKIGIHFHDTYGHAIKNIKIGLQLGISHIDSSVGNLGGCPYATGAPGNVATESVLHLLQELNIKTGIDLEKVMTAHDFIQKFLR